ncbi:hypothetical protein M9458_013585, partial [Cirrhinus mrigala]
MSTEAPAAPNPLTESVNALKAAFQPTPAPPSASGSQMAMPATFAGEAAECSSFLLQVNLFIQMQPQMFPSENAKVAFLISLLTGKALQWAKAIWNSDNPIIHSYEQFTSHFSEVFSTTTSTLTTSDQLFHLQQGTTSVNDYTLHFRTLAAASGWNETALLGGYRQGLNLDPGRNHLSCAITYSGSYGNFISQDCLNQLQLPCRHHFQVLAVKTIQGKPLGRGTVRHFVTMHHSTSRTVSLGRDAVSGTGGFHHQNIVQNSAGAPVIIIRWSEHCQTNCLVNLPHSPSVPVLLSSTQVESPEPSFTPEIPAEYMAFQDVFNKQAATHLPPHRPWDCAIELLPGAQLPKGLVYPLSIPERQAMEYIAEALSQGFIQPSTSPAASSFFFVGKKDGGLRPCIDYRQLNSQIRQQPYLLPLVPAALEELCGAQVFTKLDLRSAYNLVRIRAGDSWKTAFVTPTGHYEYRVMPYGLSISPSVFQTFMNEVFREFLHRFFVVYIDDILIYSRILAEHRQHVQQFLGYINAEGMQIDQGKVSAIQEWPQPLTVKELQCFLGFSNFYRHFIQNYSSITAPLTSLLRGKPKTLIWNPAAHKAFQRLKEIFSTAPLLRHPDPELPFKVEVDASTTGVGAVVSEPPASLLSPPSLCILFP